LAVSGQNVALASGLMLVGVGMLLEEELGGPWALVNSATSATLIAGGWHARRR